VIFIVSCNPKCNCTIAVFHQRKPKATGILHGKSDALYHHPGCQSTLSSGLMIELAVYLAGEVQLATIALYHSHFVGGCAQECVIVFRKSSKWPAPQGYHSIYGADSVITRVNMRHGMLFGSEL